MVELWFLTSVYDSYEKGHVTRLKAREIMKVENNENKILCNNHIFHFSSILYE
jgi:hypothetical protein